MPIADVPVVWRFICPKVVLKNHGSLQQNKGKLLKFLQGLNSKATTKIKRNLPRYFL